MIKPYLRQTLQLLKQNKLFCGIYIIGTGLAISMALVLTIMYYIKIAPVYPETNRSRIMVVNNLTENSVENNSSSSGSLSFKAVKELFYPLETPEAVCAVLPSWEDNFIELNNGELRQVKVKYTDDAFWRVFTFDFIDGKPYSHEEFASGVPIAIISQSLSKLLFGTEETIGKYCALDFKAYRVCGVVKDASYLTSSTYAEIWLPYTCSRNYDKNFNHWGLVGSLDVYMLVKSPKDFPVLADEIGKMKHSYNALHKGKSSIDFYGQPDPYWKNVFRSESLGDFNWKEIVGDKLLLLLFLLLVPVINLSGMVASRVKKQIEEIGIRRVFGASKKILLSQLLYQNFFLTFLGGIVGLLFSYLMVFLFRSWLFDIFAVWSAPLPDDMSIVFIPSMLINPVVFAVVFFACLVLNTFSTLLPAWKSLQRNIVDSLYINK